MFTLNSDLQYVDLTLSLNPSFLSLKTVCLFNSLKLMRKNKQDFAISAKKLY